MMASCFLPEDKLPDCWNDEARINVLFAPFRDKSVNPKDWDTKFEFWKNLIYVYCSHNKLYTFTYPELSKKFIKSGRSPACLGIVIEELYRNGDIKPLNVFQQKPQGNWTGWITDTFIKKPVVWSFTKIKDSIISPNTNICYVHITAVESEASKLLESIPASLKNKVIDLKSLSEILEFTDTEQLNILLHFLYCTGKLSIKSIQNKSNTITLIKFHDINYVQGISERDIDIYTLEQSEKTLLDDVEKLEKQIMKLIDDTKNYLSKNQRQSAKTCLRKKKEIEKCLEKRANTLHNIQTLLSRVEDAESDAQVLGSYKKALSSLRNTFSETGLSEESVSNTMFELEEVLEMHDDIQSTLSRANISVDSDIEKELEDLLQEENVIKKATEKRKKLDVHAELDEIEEAMSNLDIKLPSPPKSDDNKTKISS